MKNDRHATDYGFLPYTWLSQTGSFTRFTHYFPNLAGILILFLASTTILSAKTFTTTGLSSDWNNPLAWENEDVPSITLNNADLIILHLIEYSGNNPITIKNNSSITIKNGGALVLLSNLNLNSGSEVIINRGTLDIGPGVFNLNGTLNATNGFIIKDGNFNNNGVATLSNTCIRLSDGNFNNYATLLGTGSIQTFSGNINNDGSWPSAGIEYFASGNTSNVPGSPDLDAVEEICNCVVTNCDILPGYDPTTKVEDLIGSELTALSATFGDGAQSEDIYNIQDDSVIIDIIVNVNNRGDVVELLETTFLIPETLFISNGTNQLLITVLFSISRLGELNQHGDIINYVRPAFPAISNTGFFNSEGDTTQGSFLVRGGFDVSGAGIKVGVISDSYGNQASNLIADIGNGDLPSGDDTVRVVQDYPYGGGSDEGRAMLQIVHDVAPDAELFFRTGFISEGNFAAGITELDEIHHCDVIIDDITYITEPFLKDGLAAQAINAAEARGVTYVTSAGNFASRSYEGTLGSGKTKHDFGGGDELQNVNLGVGFYLIALQWEDNFYSIGETATGTQNDLDIYLADNSGNVLYGFNRNNIGGDPFEIMPFTVINPTTTNILIERAAGSSLDDVKFKYVVFRAGDDGNFDAEYISGSPEPQNATITGHANANGAITTGAVRYNTGEIESFSSTGGTPIANESELRLKPDFTSPDGVVTSVNLSGESSDGKFRFFGTSAAAPHAGAAAALLLEAQTKFGIELNDQPANRWLRDLFKQTASNEGVHDIVSGYGFLSPILAIDDIANPTPRLTELNLDSLSVGQSPGEESFTLVLEGEYFSDETVVYFRGEILTPDSINETTIFVEIPAFIGNPPFYVFNPSAPLTNGEDGGSSDTLTFEDPVKEDLVISIKPETKKYGAPIPSFNYEATIPGGGEIPADIMNEIDAALEISTMATPLSKIVDAGYVIKGTINDQILDPGVRELYNINIIDSLLTVEPVGVTISANFPSTIVYGDELPAITYSYTFETDVDPQVEQETEDAHANALALVDGFGIADGLTNRLEIALVDGVLTAIALVDGVPTNGIPLKDLTFYVSENVVNESVAANFIGLALVDGTASTKVIFADPTLFDPDGINNTDPLTNMLGLALVDGLALALVDGIPLALVDAASVINSLALVDGASSLGGISIALVDALGSLALVDALSGLALVDGTAANNRVLQNFSEELEKSLVLVNATDANLGPTDAISFSPITMITSLGVGTQYILPGALLNDQLNIDYEPAEFTVTKADLIIDIADKTITYGETAIPTSTVSGFELNDTEASLITGNLTYATSCTECPVSNTPHSITASLNTPLHNYNVTFNPGKLVVEQATLNAVVADETITYGESATPKVEITGFVFNDTRTSVIDGNLTFDISCTNCPVTSTDPHSVSANISTLQNYTINYTAGDLTVLPAQLTIDVDNETITYGETPSPTATITGFMFSDSETSLTDGNINYTPSCTKCSVTTSTSHSVSASIITPLQNYEIVYETGNLFVTAAELTATVLDETITYGQDPAPIANITGFVFDDDRESIIDGNLTFDVSCSNCPVTSNGHHTVDAIISPLQNYSVNPQQGKLFVTKAALIATVPNETITYGENPSPVANISGFVFDDTRASVIGSNLTFDVSCVACPVTTSGNHSVDAIIAPLDNYTVDPVQGKLYVSPADLTVTVPPVTTTYGGVISPTIAYNGFEFSDGFMSVFGSEHEVTPDNGCTSATEVSAIPKPSPANYNVQYIPGALTIDPATLNVQVNNTYMREGETLPTFTADIGETQCGDIIQSSVLQYEIVGDPNPLVAGTYEISANFGENDPLLDVYVPDVQPGTLYVNPSGGCNDKVQVQIDCREELSTPIDGYDIRLTLVYSNDTGFDIFVPHGIDNRITPGSADYSGEIPEVFLAEGGEPFTILTNSGNIKWELRTFGCLSKSRTGSKANPCPESTSATSSIQYSYTTRPIDNIKVFPNPTNGITFLDVNMIETQDIEVKVFDLVGRQIIQSSHSNVSQERIEIDLNNSTEGFYLIKIYYRDTSKVFRVLKQ